MKYDSEIMPDSYYKFAHHQWRLIVVLTILTLLSSIDRQTISLLIDPIRHDLELTDTQASLLLGLSFASAYILAAPVSGWLADRRSRRRIIGVGTAIWSTMTMVCGLASTYWQLFFARMGTGVSEALLLPSATSMIRDGVDPIRRGRAFAVLAMGMPAGAGAAMLVGGAVIGALSASDPTILPWGQKLAVWQMVLVLVGAPGLLLALLMFAVREPPRSVSADPLVAHMRYREAFAYIGRRRLLYGSIWLFFIGTGMITNAMGAWLPAMLGRVWGLTPVEVGSTVGLAIVLLAPVGLAIGGWTVDWSAKRNSQRGIIGISLFTVLALAGPGVAMPLAPSLTVFWALFAVQILASGLPHMIANTMIASVTPSRAVGRVSAIQLFVHGIATSVLGPTVVAVISDRMFSGTHALAHALSLTAAVCGAAALIAWCALLRTYRASVLE